MRHIRVHRSNSCHCVKKNNICIKSAGYNVKQLKLMWKNKSVFLFMNNQCHSCCEAFLDIWWCVWDCHLLTDKSRKKLVRICFQCPAGVAWRSFCLVTVWSLTGLQLKIWKPSHHTGMALWSQCPEMLVMVIMLEE